AAYAKIAVGAQLKIVIAGAARPACVYIHQITGSAVCPVHGRAVFEGIDLTKHNRARRLRENEKRTCESNSAESSHAAQMLINSAQQKQDQCSRAVAPTGERRLPACCCQQQFFSAGSENDRQGCLCSPEIAESRGAA